MADKPDVPDPIVPAENGPGLAIDLQNPHAPVATIATMTGMLLKHFPPNAIIDALALNLCHMLSRAPDGVRQTLVQKLCDQMPTAVEGARARALEVLQAQTAAIVSEETRH